MIETVKVLFGGTVIGACLTILTVAAAEYVRNAKEAREDRFRSLETWVYKVDRNNSLIEARLTALEKREVK